MLEDATISDFVIAADHPAIAGHFPDHPIIPAALLLDDIATRIQNKIGRGVKHFSQTRFLKPIQPGQPMALQLQPRSTTDYRFTLYAGDELCCKGKLSTLDTSPTAPPPPTLAPHTSLQDASPLYQRLPHAGNMCLIDKVIDMGSNWIYCRARKDAPPIGDSNFSPTWVGLEYAAQALACHGLLSTQADSSPLNTALIIAVKTMEQLQTPAPYAGPAYVAVKLLASLPQAASCEFTLYHNDQAMSYGQFNVTFS
jgi:predicted hotdog family 3-hydroxylacyl-ACP dehydratase